MKKIITVFTPAYNRAYCIHQLYESLLRQTKQDFMWLVIDDGSTDNTKELINSWIDEGKIDIEYIYQENQGMHGAHNTAYENIDTELNVCIDSDDYMTDNAIELIIDKWNSIEDKTSIAGILGLDSFADGQIVSNKKFPEGINKGKYFELKAKYNLRGDIKFVYRTDVINKYPNYPIFENEKFVPLGYKYLLIDQDFDMVFLNKVLCVVEYLPDGSTRNIFKQYVKNPKGFSYERIIRMKYGYSLKERFINAIHYVNSSIFSKNISFLKETSNLPLTILALPLGIVLNVYNRWIIKK